MKDQWLDFELKSMSVLRHYLLSAVPEVVETTRPGRIVILEYSKRKSK